jgi:uncharacterized protein YbjQ (UPF0145 family)
VPLLLTTADSIADHEIEQTLALVAGQSDVVEGALKALEREAEQLEADAVIAVRIDSSAAGGFFLTNRSVTAYGTAVRLRR